MRHWLLSKPPARRVRALLLALLVPLLGLFLLARALPARAAGVVGSGTPASCTEANLMTALSGGGLVTFNCGGLPYTILINDGTGLVPVADTTLDGGDKITLSAGHTQRVLLVSSGQTVTLTHISLADGLPASGPGGAIYNAGHVVLDHATLRGNAVNPQAGGGAVYNEPGTVLEARHSLFTDNQSYGGGAIANDAGASLRVDDTRFISNTSWAYFGGAIYNLGDLTMSNSLLSGNLVSRTVSVYANAQGGGGLANTSTGTLIITDTNFIANHVVNEDGGAILNAGTLTLTGGSLTQNSAFGGGAFYLMGATALFSASLTNNTAYFGGGINLYQPTGDITLQGLSLTDNHAYGDGGGGVYADRVDSLTITGSAFAGNTAATDGAALYAHSTNVGIVSSTFSHNQAVGNGGALYTIGTGLSIAGSTFDGNQAGALGGGLYTGSGAGIDGSLFTGNQAAMGGALGMYGYGLSLTNSTLAGNHASSQGGGVFNATTNLRLQNDTLSGNTAPDGGALYTAQATSFVNVTVSGNAAIHGGGIYFQAGSLSLLNTLLDSSPTGGNCGGSGGVISSTFTLSSDNTCVLPGPTNHIGLALKLSALGNYGGPTQTQMPAADSPAVDGIIGTNAPDYDQRGISRPQLGGFDIGAVERQANDSSLAPRLWLPLIRH